MLEFSHKENDMNRTNIKLTPSEVTQEKITAILQKFNIPHNDFAADPHCTILYSRDIVDVKKITLPPLNFPIVGENAHFELFDTKDDGIVLVIEFECPCAEKCFKYLKQQYDLSTRYPLYRAHITLQKNIADKHIVLPKITFNLLFDKIELDNGD